MNPECIYDVGRSRYMSFIVLTILCISVSIEVISLTAYEKILNVDSVGYQLCLSDMRM